VLQNKPSHQQCYKTNLVSSLLLTPP
jgi:hypothetical protein